MGPCGSKKDCKDRKQRVANKGQYKIFPERATRKPAFQLKTAKITIITQILTETRWKGKKVHWWILLPALLVVLFAECFLGSVKIPIADTLRILTGKRAFEPYLERYIFDFRLTKAITCMLAGGALALGGFTNADVVQKSAGGAWCFGIKLGASLAVAILLMTGGLGSLFSSSLSIALVASIGSAMIFLAVLKRFHTGSGITSLLIIGLMIGAVTSSIVGVLQYISKADDIQYYLVWTFGSVASLNWTEILILGFGCSGGLAISIICIKYWMCGCWEKIMPWAWAFI